MKIMSPAGNNIVCKRKFCISRGDGVVLLTLSWGVRLKNFKNHWIIAFASQLIDLG